MADRSLRHAVAATVNTMRERAWIRRVRRAAPFAVRVATPMITDGAPTPGYATQRAALAMAWHSRGGYVDDRQGHEMVGYFADAASAADARATARAAEIEAVMWDTRTNSYLPDGYAVYVDGRGPVRQTRRVGRGA